MHSCSFDPNEDHRPTPAHLALLAIAVPPLSAALRSASEADGVPLPDLMAWAVHVEGQLGQHVFDCLVGDAHLLERFVALAASRGCPPVITTVTSLADGLQVLAELLPDLVAPAQARPPGTVTVVIGDEHDDVRVMFVVPDDLTREH